MSKMTVVEGSLVPSSPNTPVDKRSVINTLDEIYNIELPYIGMIIYVIDEDTFYKIKTLKAMEIGGLLIEDSTVDTFEKLIDSKETEELKSLLEEQINQMDELTVACKENAKLIDELTIACKENSKLIDELSNEIKSDNETEEVPDDSLQIKVDELNEQMSQLQEEIDQLSALKEELKQLQGSVSDLTQFPQVIIADINVDEEVAFLEEKIENEEDVVGITIEPYIVSTTSGNPFTYASTQSFKFYLNMHFLNDDIMFYDAVVENKISDVKKIYITLKEDDLYNTQRTYAYTDCHNNIEWDNFILEGKEIDLPRELLKKVYDGETELKLDILIHVYIATIGISSQVFLKPYEILYSSKVKVYKYGEI